MVSLTLKMVCKALMTVGAAEPKSLVACYLTKDCNKSCGVEVGLKKNFSFKITGLNTCWYVCFFLCFMFHSPGHTSLQ